MGKIAKNANSEKNIVGMRVRVKPAISIIQKEIFRNTSEDHVCHYELNVIVLVLVVVVVV